MLKKHNYSHDPEALGKALRRLKASKLKLTPARKSILEVLIEEHGPFSAEELHHHLKRICDLATVYRTITSLEEKKLLRRCDFGDGIARYELLDDEDEHHHHHLVCNQCKKVELIELPRVEDCINSFVKKTGFKKVSHILELFGVCPDCQA